MKILLLDDHALFRAGLRMLLCAKNPQLTILEAGTIAEAVAIAHLHPELQLCLLDLNLRKENGFLAIDQLKQAAPDVAIVIVSSSEDAEVMRNCLDAGAMSFICKSAPPELLSEALACVLSGSIYLPPVLPAGASAKPPINLSTRQREVLLGLCRGLSTKSIARDLCLSDHTVKEYIAAIFRLLDVHNRTEAVIRASQMPFLIAPRQPEQP